MSQQAPYGGGVRVDMGDLNDILGGGFSEFFRSIFGGMPGAGGAQRSQPAPASYEQEIEITLQEAYQGATRRLDLDGRRIEVRIPPGARTGTKVRVAGAISGNPNGQKGDLYLVIRVLDETNLTRSGSDLITEIPINLYTAILGGETTVQTLSGKVVLTIPPGTQPGQTFRLTGRGMPHIKNPQEHGDLLVRVRVQVPRKLTPEQRELYQRLRDSG